MSYMELEIYSYFEDKMSCFFPRCFECNMFIGCDYVLFDKWMRMYEGDIKKVITMLNETRKKQGKAPLYDCCQTRLRTFVDAERNKLRASTHNKEQVSYPCLPYKLTPEHPWFNKSKEEQSKLAQQEVDRFG